MVHKWGLLTIYFTNWDAPPSRGIFVFFSNHPTVANLRYKLVTGTGPSTGWVSISLKDKAPLDFRLDDGHVRAGNMGLFCGQPQCHPPLETRP